MSELAAGDILPNHPLTLAHLSADLIKVLSVPCLTHRPLEDWEHPHQVLTPALKGTELNMQNPLMTPPGSPGTKVQQLCLLSGLILRPICLANYPKSKVSRSFLRLDPRPSLRETNISLLAQTWAFDYGLKPCVPSPTPSHHAA